MHLLNALQHFGTCWLQKSVGTGIEKCHEPTSQMLGIVVSIATNIAPAHFLVHRLAAAQTKPGSAATNMLKFPGPAGSLHLASFKKPITPLSRRCAYFLFLVTESDLDTTRGDALRESAGENAWFASVEIMDLIRGCKQPRWLSPSASLETPCTSKKFVKEAFSGITAS